jgi:hypothetical protein
MNLSNQICGSIRPSSAKLTTTISGLLFVLLCSVPNGLAQTLLNPPNCLAALQNNVGDTITVVATLTTTDPSDPFEDEPLSITSSGNDFSQTLTTYSTPTTYSYTAQATNETISGFVQGFDGDEACSLNVSTQPAQHTGAGTTNTITFNPTAGSEVQHVLQFPSDATIPSGIDPSTLQLLSTNHLVSNSSTWPQYVNGTPFAPSHCFVKPGDGGTDNCSLYEDVCFDNSHAPSDANCPVSSNSTNLINIEDVFDPTAIKPAIAQATTAALIHFSPAASNPSETWSPSAGANPVCTNALGQPGGTQPQPPLQCDISNLLNFSIHGDCCTTISGGGSKKGEFISTYNVPMLETQVSLNGVNVNTPGVQGTNITPVPFQSPSNLSFRVMPAQGNGNGFVAAPVAKITYGVTGAIADTTASFDTSTVATRTTTNNSVTLQPGQYTVHWLSVDNVGIVEQNVNQVAPTNGMCPDGTPDTDTTPSCYVTSQFTATVNVFGFSGFFQPVDNQPVVNTVKSGSAVPVKFSLGANFGLNIFKSGSPSYALSSLCTASAVQDAIETTTAAASNSLSYDPTSNQYNFVWKTPKTPGCYVLTLAFVDGETKMATFLLK